MYIYARRDDYMHFAWSISLTPDYYDNNLYVFAYLINLINY